MRVHITKLLKEFCVKNGVDINLVSGEIVRVLRELSINSRDVEIDLGAPLNSHSYPNNTESFSLLLDPLAIVNMKDGEQFKESLYYEIGHEMCHSVISQDLRFLENATLEVGWFLKNGFPINDALKVMIKNNLENVKIDSLLIENPIMMRGFYTRQFQEYYQTKNYLESKPIMDEKFKWLGEFMGVCRRAIVSRKANDKNICKGVYRVLDMNFRSQAGKFLSQFNNRQITEVWKLLKKQYKTGEDYTYEINQMILSICGVANT